MANSEASMNSLLAYSRFELNLESELLMLSLELISGSFETEPLLLLGQPKKSADDGKSAVRQTFQVGIRTQIAWLAFLAYAGPRLDSEMPDWSYGHRLYRSAWIEGEGKSKRVRIGPYRSSGSNFYRVWSHSWPLFKRHILFTYLRISNRKENLTEDISEEDLPWYQLEMSRPAGERLKYLSKDFWTGGSKSIYWASLDIAQFYPSLAISKAKDSILRAIPELDDASRRVLDALCEFRVDVDKSDKLQVNKIKFAEDGSFTKIPTGLFVSGFLANCAMLRLDKTVDQYVQAARVAHFRYVDDHFILSPSFKHLEEWIKRYRAMVQDEFNFELDFKLEKTGPEALRYYLWELKKGDAEAFGDEESNLALASSKYSKKPYDHARGREASRIDPDNLRPVITNTIERISNIASTRFDVMDMEDRERAFLEIRSLIDSELPEEEIKTDTRLSFSGSMLAKLATWGFPFVKIDGKSDANRELREFEQENERLTELLRLRVMRQCPDKVRLWEKYIRVAAITGRSITPLLTDISNTQKGSPSGALFLGIFCEQLFLREVLRAVNKLLSSQSSLWQQRNAKEFIDRNAGVTFLNDELRSAASGFPSILLAGQVTWSVAGLLLATYPLQRYDALSRKLLKRARARYSNKLVDISLPPERLDEVAAFIIQSMNGGAHFGELESSVREALEDLDENDPFESFLVAATKKVLTYGKEIPEIGKVIEALVWEGEKHARARWPLESTKISKGLELLSGDGEGKVSLFKWQQSLRANSSTDAFDPRLGEWTALAFIKKLVDMQCRRTTPPDILPHPANVFVSAELLSERPSSWEQWKQTLQASDVLQAIPNNILDSRYVFSEQPATFESYIRSLVIILLGLIRQDFRWNSSFDYSDKRREFDRQFSFEISMLGMSTTTREIMASVLSSKNRETLNFLANGVFEGGVVADDTLYDYPPISSIEDFKNAIESAMGELERFQQSARDRRCVQLVPVDLARRQKLVGAEDA